MRVTIVHEGVPIGTSDLPVAGVSAGRMQPLQAYDAIRETIREASDVLLAHGLYGTHAPGACADAEHLALRSVATMQFELRDETGQQVSTHFVNLIDAPDDRRVVVFARFREPRAVAATLRPRRRVPDTGARDLGGGSFEGPHAGSPPPPA
jgi:hypothetical protein